MTAQAADPAPAPANDLDALRVPREAPMPRDDRTRAILEQQLEAWWHRLTPGQRMTIHVEYGA